MQDSYVRTSVRPGDEGAFRTLRVLWSLLVLGALPGCLWIRTAYPGAVDPNSTGGPAPPRELAMRDPAVILPSEDRCIRGSVFSQGFVPRPVSAAQVRFYREGVEAYATDTDAQGRFHWCHGEDKDTWILGRETLTWKIVVTHPSYATAEQRLVWEWHERPGHLDIALRPSNTAKAPGP